MSKESNTTKTALVTGANKGIGFETVRQLAQKGYLVLLGARDEIRGKEAEAALRKEGLNVEFLKLDVTSDTDRKAAAARIAEHHHGVLDVLVNNAGIHLDGKHKPSDVPAEVLQKTFDGNFFSMVLLTQALLPFIRKSPAGRIVNLSSSLASNTLHSDPKSFVYNNKPLAYDASKSAVNAFTVHLAHELKETNIKVNAADPGWVKTDMGSQAAHLEVPEGAQTSFYLATLDATGPTGGFFHKQNALPW